jgi:hypothetical protein
MRLLLRDRPQHSPNVSVNTNNIQTSQNVTPLADPAGGDGGIFDDQGRSEKNQFLLMTQSSIFNLPLRKQ